MKGSVEIMKAIEILDERIRSLQEIRKQLMTEYGISGDQGSGKKTKREELWEWLKKNGEKSRREIEEGSGLKKGTIAFNLNDKDWFGHNDDGKWFARPNPPKD